MLNYVVRMFADIETNIVAVERIKEYMSTPQEKSWQLEDYRPPHVSLWMESIRV